MKIGSASSRRAWHAVAVYLGLREDDELERRWDDGTDVLSTILGVLAIAAGIGLAALVVLVVRRRLGEDTGVSSVAVGTVHLIAIVSAAVTIGSWAVRGWRRLRRQRDMP